MELYCLYTLYILNAVNCHDILHFKITISNRYMWIFIPTIINVKGCENGWIYTWLAFFYTKTPVIVKFTNTTRAKPHSSASIIPTYVYISPKCRVTTQFLFIQYNGIQCPLAFRHGINANTVNVHMRLIPRHLYKSWGVNILRAGTRAAPARRGPDDDAATPAHSSLPFYIKILSET